MKHHLSILTYRDLVSVLMYQCVQPNTVFTAVFQPYQPVSHEKHEQYAALQYVIKQRKRHLCCASLPRRFTPDSRRDDDLPKVSTLVADHLEKFPSTASQPQINQDTNHLRDTMAIIQVRSLGELPYSFCRHRWPRTVTPVLSIRISCSETHPERTGTTGQVYNNTPHFTNSNSYPRATA
jgi:hypothetical protein